MWCLLLFLAMRSDSTQSEPNVADSQSAEWEHLFDWDALLDEDKSEKLLGQIVSEKNLAQPGLAGLQEDLIQTPVGKQFRDYVLHAYNTQPEESSGNPLVISLHPHHHQIVPLQELYQGAVHRLTHGEDVSDTHELYERPEGPNRNMVLDRNGEYVDHRRVYLRENGEYRDHHPQRMVLDQNGNYVADGPHYAGHPHIS